MNDSCTVQCRLVRFVSHVFLLYFICIFACLFDYGYLSVDNTAVLVETLHLNVFDLSRQKKKKKKKKTTNSSPATEATCILPIFPSRT